MTASCIEATEFMDLTRRYRVTGVPKTIINGSAEILGAVPEEAFVDAIVAAVSPANADSAPSPGDGGH